MATIDWINYPFPLISKYIGLFIFPSIITIKYIERNKMVLTRLLLENRRWKRKEWQLLELVPVDFVTSNAAWKKVWSLCALKVVMILGDSGGSR